MKLERLRNKTLRQARRELRAGRMTQDEMAKVEAVVANPVTLAELNLRVERDVNPWNRADGLTGGLKDVLTNVWDWFVKNWPAILKIIITIAPLLLEPKRENS